MSLDLAEASPLHLNIHDVTGRLVRTIHTGVLHAGAHDLAWDGRDNAGANAGTGVFFARLYTPEEKVTLQVLRMQ